MSTGNKRVRSVGFTLIEALVAVVILGIGITAVLGGYSSLTRAEARARESETMHRLAVQKLAELRATTQTFSGSDKGDFQDWGDTRHEWSLDVQPSGIDSLDAVTVTVTPTSGGPGSADATVLVYEPQQTTTGAPTP